MPQGSSSKGKQQAHGSSSQGSSSRGPPSQIHPIEARRPATEPRNWDWTMESDANIHLTTYENPETLAEAFHHVDFQLSRAWLCFIQENIHGNMGTNHVFLKFDIKACNGHRWLGIKLEASDEQPDEGDEGDEDDQAQKNIWDPVSRRFYYPADLILGLRAYAGQPRGLKYCIELDTKFDGKTLGGLIDLLLRGGLTSFAFSSIRAPDDENILVGCRDYVTQVMGRLEAKGFIRRKFLDPTYRDIAYLLPDGVFRCSNTKELFRNDIFRALACFYEDAEVQKGNLHSLATTSQVEEGFFPDIPNIVRSRDTYPYRVARPFGYLYNQIGMLRESQGGDEGHGDWESSASMPGSSGQIHPGSTYSAQPYSGQEPTTQPGTMRFSDFLPQPNQSFLRDRDNGSYYYVIVLDDGSSHKIYGDPLTRQPYKDQWPFA